MAIVRFDPFAELNALHEQVNSLFNSSFSGFLNESRLGSATDVYSDDKQLTVEAHLPNFKENEISVDYSDGVLEIKAEHQEKEEDKKKKYLLRESVSRYYRRVALPKNVDEKKLDANFENGVLKVIAPYKELPAPKRIAIKAKSK